MTILGSLGETAAANATRDDVELAFRRLAKEQRRNHRIQRKSLRAEKRMRQAAGTATPVTDAYLGTRRGGLRMSGVERVALWLVVLGAIWMAFR